MKLVVFPVSEKFPRFLNYENNDELRQREILRTYFALPLFENEKLTVARPQFRCEGRGMKTRVRKLNNKVQPWSDSHWVRSGRLIA